MACIGGFFVSHRFPEKLLNIEFRMICRDVMQLEMLVGLTEGLNTSSFVPSGSVNPEMDRRVLPPVSNLGKR